MPVTVFSAGIILGTERYEFNLAANLAVITIGVGIASYGVCGVLFVTGTLQSLHLFVRFHSPLYAIIVECIQLTSLSLSV